MYLLQPVKSVIVVAEPSKRASSIAATGKVDREWNLYGVPLPQLESNIHIRGSIVRGVRI